MRSFRKWFAACVISTMLYASVGVAGASASAVSAAEVAVTTSRPVVTVGKQVQVSVLLKDAPSAAGMSFTLTYDKTKVNIAQDAANKDMIAFGSSFTSYGGMVVDKNAGEITIPLVVKEPLGVAGDIRTAVTITFKVIEAGNAEFALESYHVSSNASLPIHAGTNGQIAVVGTSTNLYPPGGETAKFDLKTALYLLGRVGTNQLDLNGDGVTDKQDIAVMLEQIEPFSLAETD